MGFPVGRSLLLVLVGPELVAMTGMLAEDRSEVAFVVDEHPGVLCQSRPALHLSGRDGHQQGARRSPISLIAPLATWARLSRRAGAWKGIRPGRGMPP